MRIAPLDDRQDRTPGSTGGAAGFRAAWDRVRIEEVEVRRASVPGALATVSASTWLDRLLPADVRVGLSLGGEERDEPLWCAHSYQNGRYDFELHLADERLARAAHARLVVRPAPLHHEEGLRAVVRELQLAPRRGRRR